VDDFRATLLTLQLPTGKKSANDDDDHDSDPHCASILDAWHTGLGYEREGLALTHKQILSFGNRHQTWEGYQHAEIVTLHFPKVLLHTKDQVEVGGGILIGLLIALVVSCISCVCRRLCCGRRGKKEYDTSEAAGLTGGGYQDDLPRDDDNGDEDTML